MRIDAYICMYLRVHLQDIAKKRWEVNTLTHDGLAYIMLCAPAFLSNCHANTGSWAQQANTDTARCQTSCTGITCTSVGCELRRRQLRRKNRKRRKGRGRARVDSLCTLQNPGISLLTSLSTRGTSSLPTPVHTHVVKSVSYPPLNYSCIAFKHLYVRIGASECRCVCSHPIYIY